MVPVIVVTRYRLRHPLIGFGASAEQIVTIPAGALVIARVRIPPSPGLCRVDWDGRVIEVLQMDLEQHGAVAGENGTG